MFLIDIVFQDIEQITPELTLAHRQYLVPHYENQTLLFGGRKIPRTGGIILAQHLDQDQIHTLMNQDPLIAGGHASYTITEFQAVMAAHDYRGLLG